MYFSYLLVDTGNNPDRLRPGRLWLRNRYHVHQRLCMAFPSVSRKENDPSFLKPFNPDEFGYGQVHVQRDMNSGFLFQIEPLPGSRVMIIVQSAIMPDWDYAFHNAKNLLAAPPMVKEFSPGFSVGERLRFRLIANPTRRLSKHSQDVKTGSIGKRVPVQPDKLIDWIARHAKSSGFTIQPEDITIQLGYIYMNKDGKGQRLRSVLFEGLLRVSEPDVFRKTLVRGIGSGKAFGFGMLRIISERDESSGSARSAQV